MAVIYVKAKEGRKAFFEGKPIPTDKFVPVEDGPYIRRLINHWSDLEVKDAPAKKAAAKPPAEPKSY
jgi:hypothetical protein